MLVLSSASALPRLLSAVYVEAALSDLLDPCCLTDQLCISEHSILFENHQKHFNV